jgi:hypothetical protein
MIILGVILILVGAAVWHFFSSERFLAFIGVVVALIGLLLVVVGALDAADVETAQHAVRVAFAALRSSWG